MDERLIKQRKKELRAMGISLAEFCRRKKINYQVARNLLSGRSRGNYAESHRAAVALGLKPDPDKLGLSIDKLAA